MVYCLKFCVEFEFLFKNLKISKGKIFQRHFCPILGFLTFYKKISIKVFSDFSLKIESKAPKFFKSEKKSNYISSLDISVFKGYLKIIKRTHYLAIFDVHF